MTGLKLPLRSLVLETARLKLRPTDTSDFDRAFEIRSNWHVARNLSSASFPPDPAHMKVWFAGHADEWSRGTAYRFAILRHGLMIGVVDVSGIEGGEGELGYWLDEQSWGQGYGREAAERVVSFAFEEVRLAAIIAGCASDNARSKRLLLALGFTFAEDVTIFSKSRNLAIVQHRFRLTVERWRDLQHT